MKQTSGQNILYLWHFPSSYYYYYNNYYNYNLSLKHLYECMQVSGDLSKPIKLLKGHSSKSKSFFPFRL